MRAFCENCAGCEPGTEIGLRRVLECGKTSPSSEAAPWTVRQDWSVLLGFRYGFEEDDTCWRSGTFKCSRKLFQGLLSGVFVSKRAGLPQNDLRPLHRSLPDLSSLSHGLVLVVVLRYTRDKYRCAVVGHSCTSHGTSRMRYHILLLATSCVLPRIAGLALGVQHTFAFHTSCRCAFVMAKRE